MKCLLGSEVAEGENELLSSKLLNQGQQLMSQQPVSLAEEIAQVPREEVSKRIKLLFFKIHIQHSLLCVVVVVFKW